MLLLELILSYLAGFLTLAFFKAVSEPMALHFGRLALGKAGKYIPAILDSLDYDWLPENKLTDAYDWLVSVCIPNKVPAELNQDQVKLIADYVVKTFDLPTFLSKTTKHS